MKRFRGLNITRDIAVFDTILMNLHTANVLNSAGMVHWPAMSWFGGRFGALFVFLGLYFDCPWETGWDFIRRVSG